MTILTTSWLESEAWNGDPAPPSLNVGSLFEAIDDALETISAGLERLQISK